MKYIIKMSDSTKDKEIIIEVEAVDVFEAINIAASTIENPNDTELIEACPIEEG